MKTRHRNAAAIAFVIAVSTAPLAIGAATHDHSGHDGARPTLQLDHGRKWATDAPLRKGMGDIRQALEARHKAIHKGTLDAAGYRELGAVIESRVAGIVSDCKLPPEADANLHIVVAELVAAADALQGRSAEKPSKGAGRAVAAANAYGRHFDHPGWKPLR